ncbi:MAG: hypothetical protein AB7I36_00390 [Rhodospirillaceae bacterium]
MRPLAAFALLALAACGDGGQAPAAPVLSPDGLAPYRIGMPLAGLDAKPPTNADPAGCFYVQTPAAPALTFMIQDGVVQRIEARDPSVALEHGLHLGDPAEKVHAAYGDKVDVQPHKYDYEAGSQYLTIFTPDKQRAIRYVTAAGKISAAYAGNAEAVQLVEGCG